MTARNFLKPARSIGKTAKNMQRSWGNMHYLKACSDDPTKMRYIAHSVLYTRLLELPEEDLEGIIRVLTPEVLRGLGLRGFHDKEAKTHCKLFTAALHEVRLKFKDEPDVVTPSNFGFRGVLNRTDVKVYMCQTLDAMVDIGLRLLREERSNQ